jgi:hypothetical protein
LRQQVRRQRIAQRGIEGCVERFRGSVEVATLRIEAAADEQRFGKQVGSTRDEAQVRDRRVEDTTGVLERFTSPMHASAQDAHRRDPGGAAGVEPFADAHEPIGDVDRRAIDRVSGDDLDERMVPRRDRPRVPEFGDEGLDLDVRAIGSRDFRECAQESDPGSPGRSTRDRSEGFERLIDQTESQTCFGQAGSRPVEGVDPRRERLKCDHGVEEMSPCRGGLIMDEVGPTGGRDEEAEVRSRLVAVVRAPSAHEFFGDRDLATGRMDTRALDDDACPVRPGRLVEFREFVRMAHSTNSSAASSRDVAPTALASWQNSARSVPPIPRTPVRIVSRTACSPRSSNSWTRGRFDRFSQNFVASTSVPNW